MSSQGEVRRHLHDMSYHAFADGDWIEAGELNFKERGMVVGES